MNDVPYVYVVNFWGLVVWATTAGLFTALVHLTVVKVWRWFWRS